MQLFTFGINHHTAPISIREQVAFNAENLNAALRDLVTHRPVKEAAILSTCNRTEIYCNTEEPYLAVDWLAQYHNLKTHLLTPHLYTLPRDQAVKHAFRVASGLDSMILGEPQILGQIKSAVRTAEQAGTLGLILHKLFQRTFSVAKEVRTQTDIGTHTTSMATAALRLAEKIYPSISEQNMLLIGSGEMIELCATHFKTKSPKKITIANRTPEHARSLAEQFSAEVISLKELPERLSEFDIIISCTDSPLPILGKGLFERIIKLRKHQPVFIVDLAVPRDVEPEVSELDDVFLYNVDDLSKIIESNLNVRQSAVAQAEAIIESRVEDFIHWMESRTQVPTIRALHDQTERIRRHELTRSLRLLAKGEDPEKVLEQLSRGLSNKFLHLPIQTLQQASNEEREALLALLRRLYQLHSSE